MHPARYRLHEEVGRGGAGVVYRATDLELGRTVAFKTLHGAWDARSVQRFAREIETLARLNHPHLVRLHSAGAHAGRPFLVMEWVGGGSLQQRLEGQGPLSLHEAVVLAQQVAHALAHLHHHGIVHRDVKPQNVLFDDQGQAKLVDLGLVRVLDDEQQLTQTGVSVGTPGFWAPEQAYGARAQIGPPCDVYGLGATLYAALAGAPPLRGSSWHELIVAAMERTPDPLRSQRPDADPALEALVASCLRKESERRPTLAEVSSRLEGWLKGDRSLPRRRLRWVMALAGAAVLGGAAVWYSAGGTPPSPTEAPPDVSLGAGSAQAEGESPVGPEERLRLVFHKGERLRWRLELVEEHQRGGARLGLEFAWVVEREGDLARLRGGVSWAHLAWEGRGYRSVVDTAAESSAAMDAQLRAWLPHDAVLDVDVRTGDVTLSGWETWEPIDREGELLELIAQTRAEMAAFTSPDLVESLLGGTLGWLPGDRRGAEGPWSCSRTVWLGGPHAVGVHMRLSADGAVIAGSTNALSDAMPKEVKRSVTRYSQATTRLELVEGVPQRSEFSVWFEDSFGPEPPRGVVRLRLERLEVQ